MQRGRASRSTWSIWTCRRSRFQTVSTREAPAHAHSCCAWRPFVLDRSAAALTWIRGRFCPCWAPTRLGYVWSNLDPPELVSSPANRLFVDEDHVGQALGALAQLDDEELRRLLPTHGFPIDCIDRLRNDDRPGLIAARLSTLIDGERAFMEQRRVGRPTERMAPAIADSDASDDE